MKGECYDFFCLFFDAFFALMTTLFFLSANKKKSNLAINSWHFWDGRTLLLPVSWNKLNYYNFEPMKSSIKELVPKCAPY